MSTALWSVRIGFTDKEGRRSEMQFRGAASLSTDEVIGRALAWASAILPLTDAVIPYIHCSKHVPVVPVTEPGPSSNVSRAAWLFYRNSEGAYEALKVPSIKIELLEAEGAYTGVRLVEPTTAAGGVLLDLATALQQTVTVEGEPWPEEYVNGGLML